MKKTPQDLLILRRKLHKNAELSHKEIKTSQIKLTKRILEILKHDYPEANTQTLVRNVRSFNVDKKSYLIRITTNAKEILFDLGSFYEKKVPPHPYFYFLSFFGSLNNHLFYFEYCPL